MENSSILLDRTPTTFKLQSRFNFQLLRPDQRRDAFFRVSRTFCAKCELCVFSCHLNDEKGVQTVQNWRPNYWQSSPWRCRRNIGLSSLLFPTDTESEERAPPLQTCIYRPRAERTPTGSPSRACVLRRLCSVTIYGKWNMKNLPILDMKGLRLQSSPNQAESKL